MNTPATMRGVVLTGHGGLEKLEYREDLPVPVPRRDEVLIAVSACGMNNTDINTRTGWYSKATPGPAGHGELASDGGGSWSGLIEFPLIQGADPCGRVVAAGAAVDRELVGERVLVDAWVRHPSGDPGKALYLGSELDGGYAEYVAVPASNVHPIETGLSDVELASFPCSYATAEHMLHRAGVSDGQWVLVTGASGGVGGALVQLAIRRGARVVAVTSDPKVELVRALGAEVVLDREDESLAASVKAATSGGVDVFADVVGGTSFPELFQTIRPGGHYTTAGAIAGPIVSLDLRTLYLRDLTMHGATVLPRRVFADLVSYIENGEIRPLVAATYPLEELQEAERALMRREHFGSVVIEVRDGLGGP